MILEVKTVARPIINRFIPLFVFGLGVCRVVEISVGLIKQSWTMEPHMEAVAFRKSLVVFILSLIELGGDGIPFMLVKCKYGSVLGSIMIASTVLYEPNAHDKNNLRLSASQRALIQVGPLEIEMIVSQSVHSPVGGAGSIRIPLAKRSTG